jgi:hypothetical protein
VVDSSQSHALYPALLHKFRAEASSGDVFCSPSVERVVSIIEPTHPVLPRQRRHHARRVVFRQVLAQKDKVLEAAAGGEGLVAEVRQIRLFPDVLPAVQ